MVRFWTLGLVLAVGCGESGPEVTNFAFDLPAGFPEPRVPEDNPMSVEKVALGRMLFYDTLLSGNETQSCASCHEQSSAFTDGLTVAVGSTGEMHPRNSMSLANVAYAGTLTWANPILDELEEQALVPMFGEDPVELGGEGTQLTARLTNHASYPDMFAESFPEDADPVSVGNVVKAIGAFQRTMISGDSPYDQYLRTRDEEAFGASALRGLNLFFSEKFECFHCHGGFNLSQSVDHEGNAVDQTAFFNNGLYNIDGAGAYPEPNVGLIEFTQTPTDMGRFKPPTLRNIAVTAPYMHDGSIATLDEVLDHYAAGGRTIANGPNAGDGSTSPLKDGFIVGFTLSEQERQDLLAFLNSLTDASFLQREDLSSPF